MKSKINSVLLTCGTMLAILNSGNVHAVAVNFSGTLIVPPPCSINGGTDIAVAFGNTLQTTRIDGVNYKMRVPLNIVCTAPPLNTMKLQLQGTAAPFDATVITTNKQDLGIQLKANNANLPVNTWLNFTYPTTPVIEAVPVKRNSATLVGGAFTTTATVLIDYQ